MKVQSHLRLVAAGLLSAGFAVAPVSSALADTLTGTVTMDNNLFVYLSTDDSILGTLLGSSNNFWSTPINITSFSLIPDQTYYLHVQGINQGGWGALVGQFSL